MKKRKIIIAMVVFFLGFLQACDLLETCGTCEFVTIQADGTESSSSPLPYCGDDLAEKEDQLPNTVGGVTTYWNCY